MTASQNDLFTFGPFGKKPLKEQVTPHKLSVMVLIQEYCNMKKVHTHVFTSEDSSIEIKFTEREKRNFMVTILQLLQTSDLTLKELCVKIKDKMKTELYTIFLKRLQEFIDEGVGALRDYFQNITSLLLPVNQDQPTITKSSVLGLFIRRMILAFEKLTFGQMTDLYTKFFHYYNTASLSNNIEDSQDFGGSLADSAMSLSGVMFSRMGRSSDPFHLTSDRKFTEDTGGFNSQKQAEYFILQQVFMLQRNQKEALSPSDLQDKIMDMLKANPNMAEAHFLSYLNSLRVREYCTAVHNLFHYFDRKTSFNIDQNPAQGKGKDEEVYRRYAALNLASLHYRFGHKDEAMAALSEAIGMAQDSNDNICLQHALGWLQRLSEQGTARTESLLERAVVRSLELNLPNLTSFGIQAYARHNAFASSKPSQVFEYLQRSDILNCQHSQAGFMCTSFANKAALWHMYGKRECMSMMSQLILHLDTSESGIYYNGESLCIALCNIARLHADCGQYALALDLINSAKKRFPKNTKCAKIWMCCEQEILFDRTLLNRTFGITELAVLNLKALDPMESLLRGAILNKEKGAITLALQQLLLLMDKCGMEKKGGDNTLSPDFICRVLIVLGELYSETGNHTNALTYTLQCITEAKKHHLEYMTALGMMQLAFLQLQMQLPKQALALLTQNMLPILSHGSVFDQGRLLCCYAKCKIALEIKKGGEQKKSALLSSINLLNTVLELFQSVQAFLRVKDVLYFQARLYHELGNSVERNKCSRQFKLLDSQYPTLSQVAVNVL